MKKLHLTPRQWKFAMIVAFIAAMLFSTGISVAFGLQETTIRIYHTNDIHGYALESQNMDGALEHIGYARAKSYMDTQKADLKLLVEAGDVLDGQAFAAVAKGESMARLIQKMNYDVMVPGDHDFDYGIDQLLELGERYQLPLLAENITRDDEHLFDAYIIKKVGQVKVGIFGIASPETLLNTNPENVEGLSFGTAEEILMTAAERVYQLKAQKVDVIIAVTHLGDDSGSQPNSVQLAQVLPDIDVIIDGHSHSAREGYQVGNTYIANTGEYFQHLGVVTIELKGKRIQSVQADLMEASEFQDVPPDLEIEALVDEIHADLKPVLAEYE